MIQKFIFSIRNAEVCGYGVCTWIITDNTPQYWYEDDSYKKPHKLRNKRSAGYE